MKFFAATCLTIFSWIIPLSFPFPALWAGSPPLSPASLYRFQSRWTDQDGQAATLSEFRGSPVILAMFYTSCEAVCPMIVRDMQRIEKSLPRRTRQGIRMVLVSFDSERDTPARLRSYAAQHGLGGERWTLLHGDPGDVRELAAALGVRYRKIDGDFTHSNVISIIDREGVLVHQQIGLDRDPAESADSLRGAAD